MEKLLFLLILIPIYSFSQPTDFTEEENQYVRTFFKELKNEQDLTFEKVFDELDKALKEVPYHPDLVFQLLYEKRNTKQWEFSLNYCSQLEDSYLSEFHNVSEICIHTALLLDEFSYVNKQLGLLKEACSQHLFKAYMAYENELIDEFVDHGMKAIDHKYEYLNSLKQHILSMLVIHYFVNNDLEQLDLIYSKYFDKPERNMTDLETLIIFHQLLLVKGDYSGCRDMIKLAEKFYPDTIKYLNIFKAEYLIALGFNYYAEEALINSLKVSEDDVNSLFLHFELDYFQKFFRMLINMDSKNIKIELAEALSQNLKYKNQSKLLLAMLHAEEDIARSMMYSNDFEINKDNTYLDIFQKMLFLDNALVDEDIDDAKTNNYFSDLYKLTDEAFVLLYQSKFQLMVNLSSQEEMFDYETISDNLNEIKKQASKDKSLNEIFELLFLISHSFDNKKKSINLLNNCNFCKNYDTEFLEESIEEKNTLLIKNFLVKFDVLENLYTNYQFNLLLNLSKGID